MDAAMANNDQHYTESINSNASSGVTSSLLREIKEALQQGKKQRIRKLVKNLHVSEIAEIIHFLDHYSREKFILAHNREIDPEVLAFLDEHIVSDVLALLKPEQVAHAITELDTGDAVGLLEELDEESKEAALNQIPAEERALLEKGLNYPESSAGRMMQTDVPCVPNFWNVQEALHYVSTTDELPDVYYELYVVDPRHHPIGSISLTQLLRLPKDKPLTDIMRSDIKILNVNMDREEVARLFDQYGLVSAPVIDDNNIVVGMLTVDNIVDIISEEAQEDLLNLAGVRESDFYSGPFETTYRRIPWLLITMMNVLISVFVLSQFESLINKVTALAFFLPVSAAMAGNSGLQVVTVIVRALSTRELRKENQNRIILKELTVASLNGVFFAAIFGVFAGYLNHNMKIGLVVGGALIFNMLVAGVAGTLLPITIRKMDLDPAIGAGPMLTIMTDVLGYFIYLSLASLIFAGIVG